VHAGDDDIALDQRIVEPGAAPNPARLAQIQRNRFARAKSSAGTVPKAASAVSMSARASLGLAKILATTPGTARRIFSGQDGSASPDSSRMVKLIAPSRLCDAIE
jgi:hypothetical protein